MKTYKKITAAFALLSIFSCSEDEKISEFVQDNVERGAILRTISATNTYNFFDTTDTRFVFDLSVEAQGEENGAIPAELRVYQTFNDSSDQDSDFDEILINTIDASGLPTSDNGFPQFTLPTLSLDDALDFSSLSTGEYEGGDSFTYRLELETTDGRTFTSGDLAGTVSGGSFFSSPFEYGVEIKCIPLTPFDGDYELKLSDSEEDGWNGAFITVTVDGIATNYTVENGDAEETFIVNVPSGTTELIFEYSAGDQNTEDENSFVITSPSGNEVAIGGPTPTEGAILLNICE